MGTHTGLLGDAARRYAGISSIYLTFDLSNEIQPEEIDDSVKQSFANEVTAIRAADSDRVMLHAFPGGPNMEWVDYVATPVYAPATIRSPRLWNPISTGPVRSLTAS